MTTYLFVYGTLLRGFIPDDLQGVMGQFAFVGVGTASGRLYDLGNYPGAVLDEAGDAKISGQVLSFPDGEPLKAKLLGELDDYEGYNRLDESQSLFIRRCTTVSLFNGEKVECWVYVYQGDTHQARLIPHGNYAKRNCPVESV